MFFSKDTKRVDYQLNSHSHVEENAKYLESNKENELFKDIERIDSDGVEAFKQAAQHHKDYVCEGYRKFLAKQKWKYVFFWLKSLI